MPAPTDIARPARGETRDALIRVAGELLDEGGIEAVTLREVGRRAGVSRGAAYRHFDSKEGLLAAVCAEDLRALRATLERAAARARTPRRALERMLDVFLGSARERPNRHGLLFGSVFEGRDDPELAEAATECLAVFVAAASAVLPADDLRRRDPRPLAALLIATAHGVADLERGGHLTSEKWGTDGRGVLRQLLAAVTAPGE